MNIRIVTIALIALLLVSIIGSAIVVREVWPRLANSSTGATGKDATAMTEQIAPGAGRKRAVRSTRFTANRPLVRSAVAAIGPS